MHGFFGLVAMDGQKATSTAKIPNDTLAANAFPQHPGEDALAHAATQYIEEAENAFGFAARKLLAVARGHDPPPSASPFCPGGNLIR